MALTSPRALQLGQLEGSSRLSIPGQVLTKREGRVWGGVCSGSQGEAGLAPLPWVIPASQLSLTGTKRKHGGGSLDGDAQAQPCPLWLLLAGV